MNYQQIIIDLEKQIRYLLEEVAQLREENKLLREQNIKLRLENKALKERVNELETRLKSNSTNSSKPPSSDGLKKKTVIPNLREKSGKAKGGQIGHKGDTLKYNPNPDAIVLHKVHNCSHCGANLEHVNANSHETRQVVDVIVKKHITNHVAEVKICNCKHKTKAKFPLNVTAAVQYGETVKAIGIYLSEQFIAKDRLSQTIRDLFGIEISDTTLFKFETKLAQNLIPLHEDIKQELEQAPLVYLDETGIRINGKTKWVHNFSNEMYSYFRVSNRGDVPTDLKFTVMHDHYSAYNNLTNASHVYCNAHILRELKNACMADKNPWSKRCFNLLVIMLKVSKNPMATLKTKERLAALYDKIIDKAISFYESLELVPKKSRQGMPPKRKGHNLALRLKEHKQEHLSFLFDANIPFTNNQAERDLRMVKLKQKISGCLRTNQGGNNFAVIRSFIGTLIKNGLNILDGIKKALAAPVHLCELIIT